jgi:hypothetical protein
MREIKFRAWRPDLRRHIYNVEYVELTSLTGAIIQQSTGLEDLDGGSIYEGDIIQFNFRDKRGDVSTFLGKVIWDEYMWLVETPEGEQYSLNRIHRIIIFGNIHEDLNLLK